MTNKKVKDLRIKITYEVGLGNVSMPKNVYDELVKCAENSDTIDMSGVENEKARTWLMANIQERDCCEWEAEVVEI